MVATAESLPSRVQGLKSSSLRRPLAIHSRGCRAIVDSDGSVRSFDSLREKRSLFGYEQVWLYKVQAGIIVHSQKPDWGVRVTPRSAQLSGKVFEGVEVAQSVEFYRGDSLGYLRRLRLRNGGQGAIKLRVLWLNDPSAAHFGGPTRLWGSLGVNAFNRESHVAMDEVSDPPSARVVGSSPPPTRFYLTSDRSRAQELLAAGELPEATAGMSGQVLVLSSHDIELAPGEGKELLFAAIYNPGKLEQALSDFSRIQSGEKQPVPPRPVVACSDPAVGEAAAWAILGVECGAYAKDDLDRYESLKGIGYCDPAGARLLIGESKLLLRKDGSLPHSMAPSKAGVLETSVLLRSASVHIVLSQDKKLARSLYPQIKKLAGFLMASSKDYRVETDPSLPQGWRRHLGSGYPTGEIPEVALAAAGALEAASQVAKIVSKAEEAGRFRERGEMISNQVRKRLMDERGFLALCRDSSDRLRNDETVDMAVSAYRLQFSSSAEQASAHRLLEKDFDTRYGPRCVPSTNQVYFNSAYGEGQLGAVWTRAALAYALMCYRTGLSGIGSLTLAKVARLVTEDMPKLGGSPGTFPLWVDVDGGEAHGEETDPVAAGRFIELVLEGELGFPGGTDRTLLSPAPSSGLDWVMASEVWAGDPASVFLGREGGKAHVFFCGGKLDSKAGSKYAKCERLEIPVRGVYGLSFNTPGQVLCLGNSAPSAVRLAVSFAPRAAELSKRLSTPLEIYDPARGNWVKTGSLRVSPAMGFDATIEANGWKSFRVSSP